MFKRSIPSAILMTLLWTGAAVHSAEPPSAVTKTPQSSGTGESKTSVNNRITGKTGLRRLGGTALTTAKVSADVAVRTDHARQVEKEFKSGKTTQQQREGDHVKNVAAFSGGCCGAIVGAKVGGYAGGQLGAAFGPQGAAIGAAVGSVAGGVAGSIVGEEATEAAAEMAMEKFHETGVTIASQAESAMSSLSGVLAWGS